VGNSLAPIDWIAASPESHVAVTQRFDGAVLIVDSLGAPVARIGRDGEGPGEFRMVNRIGWVDGRLWVADARLARVSVFDSALSLISTSGSYAAGRAESSGDHVSSISTGVPVLVALGADERMVFQVFPARWSDGGPNPSYELMATDSAGQVTETILRAPMPDSSQMVSVVAGTNTSSWRLPFAASPQVGISMSGDRFAIAIPTTRDDGADSLDVTMVNAIGDTVLAASLALPQVPIAAGERADAVKRMQGVDLMRMVQNRDEVTSEIATRTPHHYPPVTSLLVAPDGRVWLQRPSVGGQEAWLVLDATDGQPAFHVLVPDGVTLKAVGSTLSWGISLDADDIAHLVALRLPVSLTESAVRPIQ
jgi:hypothetical protein